MTSLKKIRRRIKKERTKTIVGYFAIHRGTSYILCDEDACVIGSTKKDIEQYITVLSHDRSDNYIIKKTTFGEIYKGMMMGGVYTLDEKAYAVFLPLAKSRGMNLAEFKTERDNEPPLPGAIRLMRIAWIPAT